jgi:hypothetical protein
METSTKAIVGVLILVIIAGATYYLWMYGLFDEEVRYYEWLSAREDSNIILLRGEEAYSNIEKVSGTQINEIRLTNKELRALIVINDNPWTNDTCYVRIDKGRSRIFFVSYTFVDTDKCVIFYYWSPFGG